MIWQSIQAQRACGIGKNAGKTKEGKELER